MQKLASASNVEIPSAQLPGAPAAQAARPAAPAVHPLTYVQGVLGPSSPVPTPCLLLKGMFDSKEQQGDEWDYEVYEDVKGECSRCGPVVHVFVDKQSAGFVYVRMGTTEGAMQAHQLLNGRIYGGRQILVEYQFLPIYNQHFRLQ